MSKRRAVGDWVWLRPGAGFVGESWRLKAEIIDAPENFDDDLLSCFLCDDPDCREWETLWTEPDGEPGTFGRRYMLPHVSECQMFDERQVPSAS